MGIFYDPLDGPMTQKKLLGIVLYCFLAIISIWATGQSLALTFDFPLWVSYFAGAAIVLIMAAMMSIVKEGFEERSLAPLIIGIIIFFIVWFISLGTNTHNFYLKGSLKDIQEEEMKLIKKELEGIQVNSEAIINDITGKCRNAISNKITNYKNEVVNPINSGHGSVADSLKRLVELSMPGSQFPLPSGNWYSSNKLVRDLADQMGMLMNSELNQRISSMNAKKDQIEKLIRTEQYDNVLKDLNESLSAFFNSDVHKNRQIISNSYQVYNGLRQGINNILISGFLECTDDAESLVSNIPETPGSIELEHISNTYNYVKAQKGFSTSEFLWSFLLALGIDLGAFAIFYFMILKNDE